MRPVAPAELYLQLSMPQLSKGYSNGTSWIETVASLACVPAGAACAVLYARLASRLPAGAKLGSGNQNRRQCTRAFEFAALILPAVLLTMTDFTTTVITSTLAAGVAAQLVQWSLGSSTKAQARQSLLRLTARHPRYCCSHQECCTQAFSHTL